jgi:hypothetical protein
MTDKQQGTYQSRADPRTLVAYCTERDTLSAFDQDSASCRHAPGAYQSWAGFSFGRVFSSLDYSDATNIPGTICCRYLWAGTG